MIDSINILAIESSCDETSAAVMINGQLKSHLISTQKIHEKWGGVVPELASREHLKNIWPVVNQAVFNAGIDINNITHIAFTQGPGLLGALLIGCEFAKGLAFALDKPLIGVNHMQAHILAHFIEEPKPEYPFLCLTVSGGHTQIVLVKSALEMEILGETTDDAVGEAFDKTAKILGFKYPGGPLLDKAAQTGNERAFAFPIPEMPGYNFSFSGVKTAFLYFVKDKTTEFLQEHQADICASIQYTLVEILLKKLRKAAKDLGVNQVAIAGGVSANSRLRMAMQEEANKRGWKVYIPAFEYCTDNAAMIAMAAHFMALENLTMGLEARPMPRMVWGKS